MQMKKVIAGLLLAGLVATTLMTGCAPKPAASADGQAAKTPDYPKKPMEFVAPAGAGGGWDLTIRTVSKTLQDTKLVTVPMPVTNRPGGGGGVNLAYMQEKKGTDGLISVYSPPILLIELNGSSEFGYKNTTPLAGLITDYGVFVVGKASKYKTITEVMDALKADPKSVKVGGTSAAGSMDHMQFLMMAKAAGVENLKEIDYIAFQDSGAAQILGGHIDLYTTGLGEVQGLLESGDLRALAQTADKRVGEGVVAEIPTCKEQGIDEVFSNWRGLFGPPEMPEYAVTYWSESIAKMVETPEWAAACKTHSWDQAYMNTEDFNKFLDTTNAEYTAILTDIGMIK